MPFVLKKRNKNFIEVKWMYNKLHTFEKFWYVDIVHVSYVWYMCMQAPCNHHHNQGRHHP